MFGVVSAGYIEMWMNRRGDKNIQNTSCYKWGRLSKTVTHCQDQSKDPVPTVEKQCIKYLNKSVLYLDIKRKRSKNLHLPYS